MLFYLSIVCEYESKKLCLLQVLKKSNVELIAILKKISIGYNRSAITIQIECGEQQLKSSILKSRKGRNETIIQTLLGTNEKTKITILVAGLILLIAVAVTLGLFIGLLDPVSLESQQTKTLSKARQGNWTMLPFHTGVI